MTAQPLKRPTKAQLLRQLLSDGRWHSSSALVAYGIGYRYGAVIERVRKGMDGEPPMDIETRRVTASHFRYRLRPREAA